MKITSVLITILLLTLILPGCLLSPEYPVGGAEFYDAEFMPDGKIIAIMQTETGSMSMWGFLTEQTVRNNLVEIDWLKALDVTAGVVDIKKVDIKVVKERVPLARFFLSPDGKYFATDTVLFSYPDFKKLYTYDGDTPYFCEWLPDSKRFTYFYHDCEMPVSMIYDIEKQSARKTGRYVSVFNNDYLWKPVDKFGKDITPSTPMSSIEIPTIKNQAVRLSFLNINTNETKEVMLNYPPVKYIGDNKMLVRVMTEDSTRYAGIYDQLMNKIISDHWVLGENKISYINIDRRSYSTPGAYSVGRVGEGLCIFDISRGEYLRIPGYHSAYTK